MRACTGSKQPKADLTGDPVDIISASYSLDTILGLYEYGVEFAHLTALNCHLRRSTIQRNQLSDMSRKPPASKPPSGRTPAKVSGNLQVKPLVKRYPVPQ